MALFGDVSTEHWQKSILYLKSQATVKSHIKSILIDFDSVASCSIWASLRTKKNDKKNNT